MTRKLVLLSLCAALCGCELVADFDRGKIPSSQKDASTAHDAGKNDAAADAGARDAATADAANDAAGSDAAAEDGG